VAMTAFLFSLAGIPPAAGWYAKFVIFKSAINGDTLTLQLLVVFMAVMTVVALFYYAGVARSLWLGTPPEGAPDMAAAQPVSPTLGTAIALSTAGVLVLGILPNLLVQYAPVSTLVAGP
jgi:NADH:ubiquinone oxidoreductase subunit 2 (subunit N)